MITLLALRAFLESAWESEPTKRADSARFLAETLPRDFEEGRYQGVPPLPPSRELRLREAPRLPGAPAADSVAAPAPLAAGREEPAIAPVLDVKLP